MVKGIGLLDDRLFDLVDVGKDVRTLCSLSAGKRQRMG